MRKTGQNLLITLKSFFSLIYFLNSVHTWKYNIHNFVYYCGRGSVVLLNERKTSDLCDDINSYTFVFLCFRLISSWKLPHTRTIESTHIHIYTYVLKINRLPITFMIFNWNIFWPRILVLSVMLKRCIPQGRRNVLVIRWLRAKLFLITLIFQKDTIL